jgi:predicted DNA-binding transcriptional regulator AlpA
MGNRASQYSTDENCRYATIKQVAAYFGIGPGTVKDWMAADSTFPRPVKLGPQTVRWRWDELKAWDEARPRVEVASEEA